MMVLDALELELRRLPNVAFVGFLDRPNALVVQLLVIDSTDPVGTRFRAEQLCRAHLERPFIVELAGDDRPTRVRLLDVAIRPDEDGGSQVEVHLSHAGVRTIGRGRAGDPSATARATMEALNRLGAQVPFEVEAAALFEHSLGEGVMLVLGSDEAGERYGVAAGRSIEQAAARATLHALNRYLATQTFAPVA